MSKLAQAMSRTFPMIHPETKQTIDVAGRNMSDRALEKYSASNNQELAADARLLLDETYATQEVVDGARRTVRVPHQAPPDVPEDDGFGPVGVTAQAPAAPMQVMPKAVVPAPQKPAPAPWDADTPEWAKRLEKKTDAVLEAIAGLLGALQANAQRKTEAHGVGQGAANGGGVLHIVKIKVTPKGDGKVGIDFFDDNPEHKYPEIRETRKATRWASTLPQGVDISDEQIYKVDWDVAYKFSDNKTEKGNPYKDVVTVTPRK